MGGGLSRRDPEVHVVVVQSQENGKMDAKLLRQTYTSIGKGGGRAEYSHEEGASSTTSPHYVSSQEDSNRPKHLQLKGGEEKDLESNPSSPQHVKSHDSHKQAPRSHDASKRRRSHDAHMTTKQERDRREYSLRQHHLHVSSAHHHSTNTLSSPSNATMETGVEDRVRYQGEHRNVGTAGEELSTLSEKPGNIFELFRTHDGEEYTVYMRDDGKRFYVDFEEQKWRYFPSSWSERGEFVPIDYDPYQVNRVREGEFIHPTRGKLATFLKQETLNSLHFFDEASGVWLPMPLSWERHTPTVAQLITEIQKACPDWKDVREIVGMLRIYNYSIEETTSAYMAINDDGILDYSDIGVGHNPFRNLTEKKLKETTCQLSEAKMKCKELSSRLEQMQTKVEELEADNKRMKKEIESGREEQRKKSRVMSRQLSHSINFGRSLRLDVVRPLVLILGEESRTLSAKYRALRSLTEKGLSGFGGNLQQLSKVLSQLLYVYRKQSKEVVEVRALYRKEAMQRKLLFNEVQELRGNIRVFCRCRYDSRGRCGLEFDGEDRIICTTAQGRKKVFEFERVYDPKTQQEKVFDDTKPTITSCADGYNVCIIAYGQTGSGKTYTMTGPRENPGVNLRSMRELFKLCRERTRVRYTMKVSMVEVYNEAVYDLLSPPEGVREKLTIQKQGKDMVVQGMTEIEVRSMQDIIMLFDEGEKNRTVASTKMNTNSSRSHLLFMLKVEGYDTVSKATSRGRLTLVDLAGSERISRSEASGIRLVEAAAINKSLSALGQVFISLRNGDLHIPYRNSKLTHLLQPCIGGDSKACMFVNISPLESNMAETISSLEFGASTRQVELGKATKHVTRPH